MSSERRGGLRLQRGPIDLPEGPDGSIDWDAAFGQSGPLELEVGSGHGGFALAYAQKYPERRLVAVEYRHKFAELTRQKAEKRGLRNLIVLRADARMLVPMIFGEGSLDVVHIHFPDPWWKRRHYKRRLVEPSFAGLLHRLLKPGGLLETRTDVEERSREMIQVIEGAGFRNLLGPGQLASRPEGEVPSTREKRYLSSGEPVYRAHHTK